MNDDQGLQNFEVYSAAKGKARRFVKEVTSRGDRPAVAAPLSAVRALIARTLARQPGNRPVPRGFSEWRTRLTADPANTPPPGQLARDALGPAGAEHVARAIDLVRKREIGPWVPDHPALHDAAARIGDLGKSEIVVPDSARSDQVDGIVDAAGVEVFDDDAAERAADRFEESAYVFWKRAREEDARACLAAAAALRAGAAERGPVARAMLDIVLEPVVSALDAAPPDSQGEGR